MFSFGPSALLWPAAAAVKALDKLVAPAPPAKNNRYPGKGKHQI